MTTSTGAVAQLHLSELLENSRVGPLQIRVFVLCMACLIMDGFDVQAMGYVAPAVLRDWQVPGPQLGPVFAAANFGVLLGALCFGMLADKIGRRPVLVGATLFFSVLTIATAYARDMNELLWLRFVSGIGLGCIIPNATALVGEFSPKKSRVALTMCITVGFTAGAAIGGFVASAMIPLFGWRSVFVFGGAVPLVIAAAMFWGLPESLQFLAVRKRGYEQLARWLRQLDPQLRVDASTQFVANETSRGGVPFVHLFRDGRALFTLLLWVVNFTNILVLYSLSNWLPTIVTSMGYDNQTAVLIGTLLQVGGTIGTFGLAWLVARRGFTPMLAVTFAVATVSIAFIGHPSLTLVPLAIIVFIAGWCIVGAQPGVNTLSASYYPTYLRATGVGAGLGVGRIGAIVGPLIGGLLLAQQRTPQQLFWAAALPAFVSTLVMLALRALLKNDRGSPDIQGVAPPIAH
jgi:AAHS family 4-hydroxybenzoate transporter-like MFS transporter